MKIKITKIPSNIKALGGDIQTNGADWTTNLVHIDAGGSHSENPYDGVQVGISAQNGQPNLVEEGETIFDDYVYSKRILIDDETKKKFHVGKKAKMSYADLSKKLEKESAERPNDPISKRGLEAQMHMLADEQDRQKAEKKAKEAQDAFMTLPPEQQAAIMEQLAAPQQEPMMAQQAPMQMPQMEMPMQEQMMAPQMAAFGGNLYPYGGMPKSAVYVDTTGRFFRRMEDGSAMEISDEEVKDAKKHAQQTAFATYALMNELNDSKKEEEKTNLLEKQLDLLERMNRPNLGGIHYYACGGRKFAEGGELDEEWFNSLSEEEKRLVSSLGINNAEEWNQYKENNGEVEQNAEDSNIEKTKQEQQASEQPKPDWYGQDVVDDDGNTLHKHMEAVVPSITDNGDVDGTSKIEEAAKEVMERPLKLPQDARIERWEEYRNNMPQFVPQTPGEEIVPPLADKEDPVMKHLLENGYDFGRYQAPTDTATIQSISRGNWKNTDGKGWRGSEDLAFKQAVEGLSDEEIDALTTEQLAERMSNTEAYKNTSKWLENSDNALLYLNTLLNDAETPQLAKNHALQFVKDGKWKDGFNYDYNTVFGKVRSSAPGTYWHSVEEANRSNINKNFAVNEDGTISALDNTEGWEAMGNPYTWADDKGNYSYSYYKRPAKAADAPVVTTSGNKPEETGTRTGVTGTLEGTPPRMKPVLKNENLRYAGLMGPIAGLGMMAAGIGKPDYSRIDAAVNMTSQAPAVATYRPVGNYLTYRPMDVWAEQNRLDANGNAVGRAIRNTSGPVGTQMAGLLANNYNNQMASAELFKKANEYNDAKRVQVADFNRGTDIQNANAFNQVSATNANIINQNRQQRANMAMHAAQARMEGDAGWYNSLYGNVNNLFKGIGDLGRENAQHNMIARMAADDLFGTLSDKQNIAKGFLNFACGGRVSRKKKKC